LKGDGKGNVNPAQIYRGGADSFSLVVADFTGDHRPEIVTANSSENLATLFLNDGNGHFGAPQGEAIGYLTGVINSPNPNAPMEAVDLNGDGKPDLILVEDGVDISQPSQLTVMLNDGTGKFLSPVRSPILSGPNILEFPRFVTGAFRNSKYPDLILISGFTASNPVLFFPGNHDGTFGSPTRLATLPNPLTVVSEDFNQDGNLDFVVYSTNADYTQVQVDTFLGRGDGTFKELPEQNFASPSTGSPLQIFALDLNHDGKTDLLIGNNLNGGWTDSGDDLVEFLGNGDGTFQAPKILIPHFGAVAVADLNGDGFPDLIQGRDPTENVGEFLFGTPAVTVYLGTANGTFVQQSTYTLPGSMFPTVNPVLVGDFNGDGILDIGYRNQRDDLSGYGNVRIRILQGVGDGTFIVTGHIYDLPTLSDPFVGADFSADGMTDLIELTGLTPSFETIPAAAGPSLDIAFDSSPILATKGSATVTLNIPASSVESVILSASDPAVQLPSTLSFATGQQKQSFSFTLGPNFDSTHALALSATLGAQTAVAYATRPNPNAIEGVSESLSLGFYLLLGGYSVTPGESFQLTLQLLSQSGYSGKFSSFQCGGLPAGASCSFDSNSLIVYPGWSSETSFTVNTSSSTPYGMYPVQVTSTDGFFPAAVTLPLGIGNFSLSLNPTMIVLGPNGYGFIAVGSTSTNGLSEFVTISCSGLPAGAGCEGSGSILQANGGGSGVTISSNGLAVGDYPFQVAGTANIASQSANALLRVGDFTAALNKNAATLSPGQSATFTVTLTSLNHYTSSISIFCQSPSNSVTCTVSPLPASLTDNGTATVQLTVSASASAAAIFPRGFRTQRFDGRILLFILTLLFSLLFVLLGKLRNFAPGLGMVILLMGITGCGSSGGTSGTTQPVSPLPPQAQTVNLPVVVSAAFTTNDASNQKTLGPIVITVN
jgi:FG-GAP-like repeat